MRMLLGVLDIGSNSAQLQVFEARPGAPPLATHAVKEPTLLGESFDPDGAVEPAGVDRVVDLILDRVEAQADVIPQYLTGEDEARLINLAWRSSAACSP